jgi:hypothetical protein
MTTNLAGSLAAVAALTPQAFAGLGEHLSPEWLVEALSAGECGEKLAQMRRRKLPAEQALWLVIGMAVFRDRSIEAVAEHLSLVLPRPGPRGGIAPSALTQARHRLGAEPMEHLFGLTGEAWGMREADKDRWRGLSLWGLDGTCMRIADTTENETAFGRPGSGRSESGYPQLRLVGLMALRSHTLAGLAFGGVNEGETRLCEPLWKQIPDQSLSILDRNFLSWGALHQLQSSGVERHWLLRLKKNVKYRVLQKLGRGDELVEITTQKSARAKYSELPKTFQARVVGYQVKGYKPQKLITSMLDAERYPATEFAALYHERWELELAYDEIKTHMLEREEALRSRTPELVRQELYGIAIAYNLVRCEMARVAARLGIPPTRISFRNALLSVRNFCLWAWNTSPGALPKLFGSLDSELRLLVLPARRSERRFPRAVKIKMSGYARNHGKSSRAA